MKTLLQQTWEGHATTLKHGIAGGPTFTIEPTLRARHELVLGAVELCTHEQGMEGLRNLSQKNYRVTVIVEEVE